MPQTTTPDLVLGPVVRMRGAGCATVWVETDAPCVVGILGRREPTFRVAGRHYAVVVLEGLPDAPLPYAVALDGVHRWPPPAPWGPDATLPAPPAADRATIAVGSCRVQPGTAGRTAAEERALLGPDALAALAARVAGQDPGGRPDLLLLVGDQVYVDHPGRPRPRDFDGHAGIYRRAWGAPEVRWLLGSVPTATILDDHEVGDGWSPAAAAAGRRDAGALGAALAAYWVYQHLGNLTPAELRADPLLAAVRAAGDGMDALGPAARRWLAGGTPFAHARRAGPARLVVMDARTRRVRTPRGRSILDPDGWRWLDGRLRGDADHLLLVTSVPAYMTPGLHHLEAWGAALGDGGWGRPGRWLGRRLRPRLGLEHWPSQGRSLDRLTAMLAEVAGGLRGRAPASVVLLTGEVHHGRVDRVRAPALPEAVPVWQVTSSPLRNRLGAGRRAMIRLAGTRPFALAMRLVAWTAGVPAAPARVSGDPPLHRNHVALLELDGRRATVRVEAASEGPAPALTAVRERRLA